MTTAVETLWTMRVPGSLHPEVRDELRRMCKLSAEEICGFIIDHTQILTVPNVAENPTQAFRIAAEDSVRMHRKYGDRITGIFHSHPSGRTFMSPTDVENAEPVYRSGCPWRYYIVTSSVVAEYEWIG